MASDRLTPVPATPPGRGRPGSGRMACWAASPGCTTWWLASALAPTSLTGGGRAGSALVRFPNSLAFGSELGLHYPYRRGIFLLGPTTQPIVDENGQWGAYWIRPHLLEPHAPSHFCSLTGFVTGTPCSSSTRK